MAPKEQVLSSDVLDLLSELHSLVNNLQCELEKATIQKDNESGTEAIVDFDEKSKTPVNRLMAKFD